MTAKTYRELLAETKSRIKEISAADSIELWRKDPSTVFLDVREPQEWNLGRIPRAVFIPRGNLESRIESTVPRDAKIVVYCARGNRSAFAAETLEEMGYGDVQSMTEGWSGWIGAGGEVEG
jgi:sulfur-carrier protein adenylyltransferase/sulfurtransferase